MLKCWIYNKPYSTDPLHYDYGMHHMTFHSLLGTLVTQYKIGNYVGVLAKQWKSSNNFKNWTFTIKKDMTFENGDPITPEIIIKSWTRLAYLMKIDKSKNGLFENIFGYEKIISPTSTIPGLKTEDNNINLQFTIPMKNLLETISFGFYAATHPHNYDPISGKWLNDKQIISSGSYRLVSWSNENLIIEKRSDFPSFLFHAKPIKEIVFSWNIKKKNSSDIIFGSSIDKVNTNHIFYGGAKSRITYVRCLTWNDRNSPFYDLDMRKYFRSKLYSNLQRFGFSPTLSFFPLAIKNCSEFTPKKYNNKKIFKSHSIRYAKSSATFIPYVEPYINSLKEFAIKHTIKAIPYFLTTTERRTLYNPNLKEYPVDLALVGTGLLIDKPDADIRFMFESKEGIQLPDTDGRIHEELKKEPLDVQKINEILWDQAVIWPITHYAGGLWAIPELDFSMINTTLPPTEFQWIGWK